MIDSPAALHHTLESHQSSDLGVPATHDSGSSGSRGRSVNRGPRGAPDPLRSQFRLSRAQVLSVLQSAAEQGSKGEEELEDLHLVPQGLEKFQHG